ncbi:MAG: carbohydrate ABC transporter permease [Thermotoga sp.]|nr:MAG: carbohydrate ABC transporter permease [Thermotoga sp.]
MKRFFLYLGVAFMIFYCLFPIYFLILDSFEPTNVAYSSPPILYPIAFTLSNYIGVFKDLHLTTYIMNSTFVSLSATAIVLFIGALAAFAITKIRFIASNTLLNFLLILGFFPAATMIFPLYKMFASLRLLNNYLSLILPYVSMNIPLTVWVLTTYFEQIPNELYEAARVDGMSRFQAFYKVIVPLGIPAVSTVAILDFIACWNEFILALTFMTKKNMRTITVGISMISGRFSYQYPWGEIIAGALLVTLPLVIIIFVAQEKIISGLTAGAIKG